MSHCRARWTLTTGSGLCKSPPAVGSALIQKGVAPSRTPNGLTAVRDFDASREGIALIHRATGKCSVSIGAVANARTHCRWVKPMVEHAVFQIAVALDSARQRVPPNGPTTGQ